MVVLDFILKKLSVISFAMIYPKNIREKKVSLKHFGLMGSTNWDIEAGVMYRHTRPKQTQFLKYLKTH